MKFLLVLFICMGAVMPQVSYAQIDGETDPRDAVWEMRETALDLYEIQAEKVPEKAILPDETITTKKGRVFTLHGAEIEPEHLDRFLEMPEEKQRNFQEIRLAVLARAAAILNTQSLTIGAAIATQRKLVGLFKKKSAEEISTEPTEKPKLRDLGAVSIEKILNNLNKKFWVESAKVGEAKEVSFYIKPTGHVVLALGKAKAGGAIGAALAIGYNKETDVVFLDVIASYEKVKSGLVGLVAFKLLAGFDFDASQEPAKLMRIQRGETSYPILVPFWEGTGKQHYSLGASLFTLSVPPVPFTDAFHYRNTDNKIRLLRLGINTMPLWELVYNSLKKINASEKLLTKYAEKARVGVFARTCSDIFK